MLRARRTSDAARTTRARAGGSSRAHRSSFLLLSRASARPEGSESNGGGPAGLTRLACACSAVGFLECAFLAWSSWTNGNSSLACSEGGSCASVLGSDFASVLGLPLPFLGALGYAATAAFAWKASQRRDEDRIWDQAMLYSSWSMAGSSLWLMVLLHAIMKQDCDWCHVSAFLSISTALSATFSIDTITRKGWTRSAFAFATTSALALALVQVGPDALKSRSQAQAIELPYVEAEVEIDSSERAQALAGRLRDAGAKMYGAFWCGHCYEQKESFGKQAMAMLPYVECYPEGFRRGFGGGSGVGSKQDTLPAKACQDAQINGFPTWIVGGERLEGEQTFDALEKALDQMERKSAP